MTELKASQLKNHKVLSLISACAFPAVMYALAFRGVSLGFAFAIFTLLVLIVEAASWYTLRELHEARPWLIVRSVLFYSAWVLLFFLLPSSTLITAFTLISVPVLFLGQQLIGYTGETVLITHTILTGFGLLLAAAAAEFYFHAGSLLLTVLVFVCVFALTRATYVFVPQVPAVRLAASLAVALMATELYAAALFLPFHYTVTGFIAFLGFYILWLFTYYWQFKSLTKQKIKFYAVVAAILAIGVLLATPWRIMA